ncbi:MAG TPA: hypothetical protein VLX92_14655 [Kofleriaceae bacterium]|nr:hypothetical protein [Kofleriaceae bacterium]
MSRAGLAIAALAIASAARADNAVTPADHADALAALLARTDAIAREVASVRHLPLRHPIPNEVVDRDELRARLEKEASDHKTAEQTRLDGIALARWGLIPYDTDYTKLLIDLLTDQIAGYYDPDTKKLTISRSAGDDPEWAEMVLAHELDHGLQDQAYDLKKFDDLPDGEDDAAAARHALEEGDGIALMIEVALERQGKDAPWADPAVAGALIAAMSEDDGDSLDQAPLAVRESMLFPYRAGLAFVAALRRRGPWSAVDAAYKRPPRSTEQIMHPEKYLADEKPIPVRATAPKALDGYAIQSSTVWGELGFQLFLRAHGVPETTATIAAAGWGGDRAVILARPDESRPDHVVGLARLAWDSEADAIEAYDAAVRAVDDAAPGATVEHGDVRTRWLALDGTQAWVERRGTSIVIALGVPAPDAAGLLDEAWTATTVGSAR